MLLRVFVDFVVSRHKGYVRFRLCPFSTHDEDGNIGGEAGKASGEPRDILRDVDGVTTVCILPSFEAVDTHDRGDLCDEHLCSTCVISSSCGGTSPRSMSLSAEKALRFFLPLRRLRLCVCGRAGYIKSKVRRIM